MEDVLRGINSSSVWGKGDWKILVKQWFLVRGYSIDAPPARTCTLPFHPASGPTLMETCNSAKYICIIYEYYKYLRTPVVHNLWLVTMSNLLRVFSPFLQVSFPVGVQLLSVADSFRLCVLYQQEGASTSRVSAVHHLTCYRCFWCLCPVIGETAKNVSWLSFSGTAANADGGEARHQEARKFTRKTDMSPHEKQGSRIDNNGQSHGPS